MKRLIGAAIIGLIIIGIVAIAYDYKMKHVVPFEGSPQDHVDVLRQNSAINDFYTMYERYGINIANMTEEQVRFVFTASDGENRIVNLDVRYYDGKPDTISHRCYEKEPHSRIFSEESVMINCFE